MNILAEIMSNDDYTYLFNNCQVKVLPLLRTDFRGNIIFRATVLSTPEKISKKCTYIGFRSVRKNLRANVTIEGNF